MSETPLADTSFFVLVCALALALESQSQMHANAGVRTSECDTFNKGEFNYNKYARCMAINGMN